MKIKLSKNLDNEDYKKLVKKSDLGMFFHSPKYLSILKSILDDISAKYLLAYEKNTLLGAIPLFVKYNNDFGNVLNSLPFYGSHGGVITRKEIGEKKEKETKRKLLRNLKETAVSENSIISTTITAPFETDGELYQKTLEPSFMDTRIGQIKTLPETSEKETLLYDIEKRCRTAVRKAIKSGVEVSEVSEDDSFLSELYERHVEHMESIGGTPKPKQFYDLLPKKFERGTDYTIHIAEQKDSIIGILLSFYYKNWVEYFTPVTSPEHRSLNPMNLIIFEAMREAIEKGYKYWNFGGTWKSQTGVYRFKKSFQSKDYEYKYYINKHDDISKIKELSPKKIQNSYKFFYVIPFDVLK